MVLRFAKAGIFVVATLLAANTYAQRMDEETHSLLIQKLESALATMSAHSSERPSVTLRLADLYADRARLAEMAKQEAKCPNCTGPQKDRARAIQLYRSVVDSFKRDQQGDVLLQLAHLESLQNLTQDAIKTLNRASNEKAYSEDTTSRANAALGEIHFRQAQYALAEKEFKKALAAKEPPHPGFISYRLAWTELNQGKTKAATEHLIKLLKTPELLTQEHDGKIEFDQSFHDDVTRDLVTFIARGEVTQKEVDLLLSLSPEHLRRENVYNLANELERLGKKYSATLAWKAYNEEGDHAPGDGLESQIRMAQLEWDMGRRDLALTEYQKAAAEWRKKGCKGEKCDELAKRMKNFVINWNKTEKDQPTRSCLEAYKAYIEAFPQDPQTIYMAATVADQLKLPNEANALYAQTAALAADQGKLKDPNQKKFVEAALLKQIETAELAKSNSMRLKAYDNYLALMPGGEKAGEVRYQKAHVTYEMGQLDQAYDQFMDLALGKKVVSRDLQVKSADLTLDILAAKKDHERIYSESGRLAKIIPERRHEYDKLQRQAAIQLAASRLEQSQAGSSQLAEESKRLKEISLIGASRDEQILVLKNRIAIGEKRQDLGEVKAAAAELLKIRGLSASDREFALGRLVWVAELSLDFKTALRFSRQMNLKGMSNVERHLKFAMLSELGGLSPVKEYRLALKAHPTREQAEAIHTKLVRLSRHPWTELKEFKSDFSRNPTLFGSLIVEAYSRDPSQRKANELLKERSLRHSPLAVLFERREFLNRWSNLDKKLRKHQIATQSESLLQNSLSVRMKMLGELDKLGQASIQRKDWEGQLLVVSSVARENQRLYETLVKLPVPKRLKGNDRKTYTSMLMTRAQPFADRAKQAGIRLKEFWKNEKALTELTTAYNDSNGETRRMIRSELSALAQVAPDAQASRIEHALKQKESAPSLDEFARAKMRLAREPFDADVIAEVKRLSEARGETTMVAFLDARLSQMRKGVKR